MGTCNGEKFIKEQLESLANQRAKPCELVVCDDVSDDDTVRIIDDFSRTAPFPVHVHVNGSRLGFGDNFLKAAHLCTGSLVAFCDQDDVWYPEKLEACANALEDSNADLCAHDADLCGVDGSVFGYHSAGVRSGTYDPMGLDPWGAFFGFTCTFRRCLLDIVDPAIRKTGSQDARLLSHDGWLYFLANSFGKTVYLAKPLAKYRQHGANLFGSNDLSRLQKVRRLILEYEQYLGKYRRLASVRAGILDGATPALPPRYATSVSQAKRYWKNIETLQGMRLGIASDASLIGRSRRVVDLWRRGAYAPAPAGGLGGRALAEDSVAALSRIFVK